MSWKMEGHDRGGNKGKKNWNQRLLKNLHENLLLQKFPECIHI